MSTGYEVVPESLNDLAKAFGDAHDAWVDLKKEIDSWRMETYDFGVLAAMAHFAGAYNDAVDAMVDKLGEGVDSLDDAEDALHQVAEVYADTEARYYTQFGYAIQNLTGAPR